MDNNLRGKAGDGTMKKVFFVFSLIFSLLFINGKEYNCDTVVVGLPKNLNGTDSIQTEKVYEFKSMLENKMRSMGMSKIGIEFQDERFTTLMAEKVLIEADVSRKKRKDVIDKQAAVLILQGYLERMRNIRLKKEQEETLE